MHRFVRFVFIAAAVALPMTAAADTLNVDTKRSELKFVSDAPKERFIGKVEGVKGTVEFDAGAIEKTTAKISFPVSKMNTGNKLRDKHMVGSDWLNAKENPEITLVVKGLKDVKEDTGGKTKGYTATVVGDITINGVTKPAKATVQIAVASGTIRVQPTMQVKLADHNVEGKKGVVGDKVGETVDIEGVIYAGAK